MAGMSYVRDKLLNPRVWGRSTSCAIVWSMVVGATVGGVGAWWFGKSWIEFEEMEAYYVEGEPAIYVSGVFHVNRECSKSKLIAKLTDWLTNGGQPTPKSLTTTPNPVIWRVEALATDGQIALYGPQPVLPDMTYGEHFYNETLPLLEEIKPDGWRVTVISTCVAETGQQTIASNPVTVRMVDPATPRGGEL